MKLDSDCKIFVTAAGRGSSRWCHSDCAYWLHSYLRVSQINEHPTTVTTSLLMSYGILDCRWQPSNNSSIAPPQSLLLTGCPPTPSTSLPRKHSFISELDVSLLQFLSCLAPAFIHVMCDMYHWLRPLQTGMLTFPRASSSLPAELSAVELCWLMILIAPHTAWLSVDEGRRKRQKVKPGEKESERKCNREKGIGGEKKLAQSWYNIFFHKPCFHGNHIIRRKIETVWMYRKKKHNRFVL